MIVEGKLVDREFGVRHGQVQIHEGRIARVGDLGLKPDLKAADDEIIFPGFVDVHVHLRQGEEYKEDYQTATQAALHGGVTGMLDMPNNPIPPRADADLALKRSLVQGLPVNIDFYLGIGPDTRPGMNPFYKAFMGPSIGPLYFDNDAQLEEALQHYSGRRVTLHCEDPELLREYANAPTHEEQRAPRAEIEAIKTALRLAKKYGFHVHVAHLTTPESLELLEAFDGPAEADTGLPGAVWEATPHHLYFDIENRKRAERNTFLKMNPPLRTPASRAALLEAFLGGRIHFLSTDHAPHTVEEKSTKNPSGVPLLDTHGAFITWLMSKGFTPEQVALHCCELPGKFMRHGVGRIKEGYAGHLAILAPVRPWTVRAQEIRSKCAWSPFEGETFPGQVSHTIASGQIFRGGLPV